MNVSVVVCVRDGEPWLDAALTSIATQRRPPDETVVVDDGSTDGSMAIAARHDVRVVHGPRAGVAAAHDAGIAATRGNLVGFLAQDDLYLPGALEALLAALAAEPDAGMAHGRALLFTDAAAPFSGLRQDRVGVPQPSRIPETVLIRRELLLGLLPLHHDTAWDIDLFLRLDGLGVVCARTDEIICRKRLRPCSATHAPGGAPQQQML